MPERPATPDAQVFSRRERLRAALRRWRLPFVLCLGLLAVLSAQLYGSYEAWNTASITLLVLWPFWMILGMLVVAGLEMERPIPLPLTLDRRVAKIQLLVLLAPALSLLSASAFDGQIGADPLDWPPWIQFLYVLGMHLPILAALAWGSYHIVRTRGRRADLYALWLPPVILLSLVGLRFSPAGDLFTTKLEIANLLGFLLAVGSGCIIVAYRMVRRFEPPVPAEAPAAPVAMPTFRSYLGEAESMRRHDPPR